MTTFIVMTMVCFWIGLIAFGAGYWLGWTRAKHPGKVEGLVDRAGEIVRK